MANSLESYLSIAYSPIKKYNNLLDKVGDFACGTDDHLSTAIVRVIRMVENIKPDDLKQKIIRDYFKEFGKIEKIFIGILSKFRFPLYLHITNFLPIAETSLYMVKSMTVTTYAFIIDC